LTTFADTNQNDYSRAERRKPERGRDIERQRERERDVYGNGTLGRICVVVIIIVALVLALPAQFAGGDTLR